MIEVRKPTQAEIKLAEKWPTWSKEISEFRWNYDQAETCLILNGRAKIFSREGAIASFGAGDWVVFPKGLECIWKITEPIEKKYYLSQD